MEHRVTTKVYHYRVYDAAHKAWRVSRHKATRDAIAKHLDGDLLEGTAQEVAADELDERGQYRRLATGWGEFD